MIRVKFISREMGMNQGGGEINDMYVARGLEQLGLDVSFIVRQPVFSEVEYSIEEFCTEYCSAPYLYGISHRLPRTIGRVLRYIDSRWFAHNCIKYLKREPFDIVQITGSPPIAYLKKHFNQPIVYSIRGPISRWYSHLIKRFDALIAWGGTYTQAKQQFPQKKIIHLNPGVDTTLFHPVNAEKIRERYQLYQKKVLLFVGRFVILKNLPFLISTFEELLKIDSSFVLLLIGDGPLENQLKSLVKSKGLHNQVIFLGRIPHTELPYYYSAADVFVMSSTHENYPIVILEAMSCGLPIVAPRVGGIPLIVEDGKNGILFQPGSSSDLKNSLLRIFKEDKMLEIGKINRKKIEDGYDWKHRSAQIKDLYISLV